MRILLGYAALSAATTAAVMLFGWLHARREREAAEFRRHVNQALATVGPEVAPDAIPDRRALVACLHMRPGMAGARVDVAGADWLVCSLCFSTALHHHGAVNDLLRLHGVRS